MAFSSVLSPSCTLQTQSTLLSSPNQHSLSPTTSFLRSQATQKFLYQPLRHKRVSLVNVGNPRSRRSFGKVKALDMDEKENVKVFPKDELPKALAQDISDLSKKFIQDRGFFTVVLSGGPLIKHIRKLVQPPHVGSIEWSKWHFFWVEERVLPKDHPDTNYKLAYDGFLSKVPNLDLNKNVHSINGYNLPAKEAATRYENELKELAKDKVIASSSDEFPEFDLMLLDIGSQAHHGHPDYLLSDNPTVEDHKWVTFTTNFPRHPKARIALTLPVINASSNIKMVVYGASKAHAVHSILEDLPKPMKLPIELVSPKGKLKWYLDEGAASHPFFMD